MNKAEEQYFELWGEIGAKLNTLKKAWEIRGDNDFISLLKIFLFEGIDCADVEGYKTYLTTIIHAINCKVITNWPSFVTYMTGETYE